MSRARFAVLGIAAAATLAGLVAPALSQEKGEEKKLDADTLAYMKQHEPGAEHKRLEALAGKWNLKLSNWFKPGAPPTVSEGTAERRAVLGGRFLETRWSTTAKAENLELSGVGYTGFDNDWKRYTSIQLQSTSTSANIMMGEYDDAAKAITYKSSWKNPANGMVVEQRVVVHFPEKDKQVTRGLLQVRRLPGGEDGRVRVHEGRVARRSSARR